jgi:hypothetical protein
VLSLNERSQEFHPTAFGRAVRGHAMTASALPLRFIHAFALASVLYRLFIVGRRKRACLRLGGEHDEFLRGLGRSLDLLRDIWIDDFRG